MSSLKTKNTKQVDLFKELDDATLATMLQESDMIRFIDSKHAYSWDEDTLLWTPINSKLQINTMVRETLEPIIEERKKALQKLKIEAMEDNDDTKIVRIAKALKQCQSIGSATKVKNIIAMAGRSVVSQEFFNKKTLTQRSRPSKKEQLLAGTSLTQIACITPMISESNASLRWWQTVAFMTWSVRTWKNKPESK